jgi:U3 small nucleolar RNA-associated protein 7
MDALIAKADAIHHLQQKKRSSHGQSKALPKVKADHTMNSVVKHTSIPKSLKDTRDLPKDGANYKHIANKKLRVQLTRQSEQKARAQALVEDADMLLMENAGGLVVEGEMERTWRVGQNEIVQSAGQEAAKGRQEYRLDGGPYQSRFTRNGRFAENLVFQIIRSD